MDIEKLISETETIQLVVFRVGEDYLSCPISQIREIIRLEGITPVPSTPEVIRGIINRRGDIVTIVDLPKLLDINVHLESDDSQLMILYSEDEDLGVLTSEVVEIPTVETSDIDPPNTALSSPLKYKYLKGILKRDNRLIFLTDILEMTANISQIDMDSARAASEDGRKDRTAEN